MTHIPNSINYIEFPLRDSEKTKRFYSSVFGWKFTDWGDNYISFTGASVEGGFNGVDNNQVTVPGVLVVLYTDDLERVLEAVENAGAPIVKPIYSFPGGRRFHFQDPNGNELAIWTEQ